ncbi:DNA-binding transcriptional regulator, LysR family [Pseudomonas sp. NFACC19-2]|uniref:DNA-binding transcriptional regulator, LysR family n=1 Tax=Ectopseudomonas toyotomiensis TaxID=554344 RepID=A0A1I5PRM8_9GAMM|nr:MULTISPECIES: LysR family transcriptional regulator [Pseudomonas]AQZ35194.1 LysR family transcriptional regulator [Pseudomonas sp. LPH1]MBG0841974.1 LysR family transcriptional regulator [Pseudomonas toyotomiensis]PIA73493.1 LysR family transcriptional regulator [Pseudomonas toyotomiensis]SDA50089.1 DNA-binding transcriptional regulator, LysR family [Pseudomonas sp. NFPP33]SFP36577.1 DNA-binding transcriptional regulator, LysR family [Pseudomonas toyotomiensis]
MNWNLDQLQLFVRTAESRSFSAAARQTGRAQSAVSTAIALLESDLGVTLFERSSGRQPQLTEAGAALLEQARSVLQQCERLDGRALGLARGEEARLRLAQDEAMPYQPVLASLEALADAFPLLEVQLSSGAQGDVARKLLQHQADLGLLFHHEQMPRALESQRLGTIEMVTVCSPHHPLAELDSVERRDLAEHRQLLMTPQDSHYPGGEQISPLVWRADSFYVMAELVIRGVGWAWLPRHVAQYPTYQGHLQELRSDWAPLPLVVELVCRRDGALGPAANWLADCLARELLRPQA